MLDFAVLIEPFQFEFMQYAFYMSVLIILPMSLVSCYLVLKGWSLMGDAISHAVLPGIVLAYLAGVPLQVGAFVSGLLCVSASGFLKRTSRIKEDTAMGIVFAGIFGFGLVLYRKINTDIHLDHILFGNLLGLDAIDLLSCGIVAVFVCVIVFIFRKDLLLISFDEQHAKAIGLNTAVLHYGLLALVALVIVSALNAVGMVLAVAVLIAPGVTAYLLTDRFERMMLIAATSGCTAGFVGVYLSFFLDSAPAPTIVLIMMLQFICAYVYHKFSGRMKSEDHSPTA